MSPKGSLAQAPHTLITRDHLEIQICGRWAETQPGFLAAHRSRQTTMQVAKSADRPEYLGDYMMVNT